MKKPKSKVQQKKPKNLVHKIDDKAGFYDNNTSNSLSDIQLFKNNETTEKIDIKTANSLNPEVPTINCRCIYKNVGESSMAAKIAKKYNERLCKIEEDSRAGIFSPEVFKKCKTLEGPLECGEDIKDKMKDVFDTLLEKWTIGSYYGKNNLDNIINYLEASVKMELPVQKDKVREILSIASESESMDTTIWCEYLMNRANKIYTNISKLWEYRWPLDNFELEQQNAINKFMLYFTKKKKLSKRSLISLKELYKSVEQRLKDGNLEFEEFKQLNKVWSIIENHANSREDILNGNYGFNKEMIERIQELPMSYGGKENE
jgi:hypothetical protein